MSTGHIIEIADVDGFRAALEIAHGSGYESARQQHYANLERLAPEAGL